MAVIDACRAFTLADGPLGCAEEVHNASSVRRCGATLAGGAKLAASCDDSPASTCFLGLNRPPTNTKSTSPT